MSSGCLDGITLKFLCLETLVFVIDWLLVLSKALLDSWEFHYTFSDPKSVFLGSKETEARQMKDPVRERLGNDWQEAGQGRALLLFAPRLQCFLEFYKINIPPFSYTRGLVLATRGCDFLFNNGIL